MKPADVPKHLPDQKMEEGKNNQQKIGHDRRGPLDYHKSFERQQKAACYECGSTQHFRRTCPKLQKQETTEIVNSLQDTKRMPRLFEPYLGEAKVNGKSCRILRDSAATRDLVNEKLVRKYQYTGRKVSILQPLDTHPRCLPVARVKLELPGIGEIHTQAAVVGKHLDRGFYLLSNRTEEAIKKKYGDVQLINTVVTRSPANRNRKGIPETEVKSSRKQARNKTSPKKSERKNEIPDLRIEGTSTTLVKTDTVCDHINHRLKAGVKLTQKDGESREHPMVLLCEEISPAERRCSTCKEKCTSGALALKGLDPDGQPVREITDHHPVVRLQTMQGRTRGCYGGHLNCSRMKFSPDTDLGRETLMQRQ